MRDLKNRTALVTGAGGGIGRAVATSLARAGANPLVLNDIDLESLEETCAMLGGIGCKTLALRADVSDFTEVKDMVDQILERFGSIDILVNVAGVLLVSPIEELDLADWRKHLGVNLLGMIHTIHAVYPHMLERRSGHIVNITSTDGLLTPNLYVAPYVASKFGAVGFSEALMLEASVFGIGVTCVCPGVVRTPILDPPVKGFSPDVRKLIHLFKYIAEKPEKTACRILKAVKRNHFLVVTTPPAQVVYFIRRHFPRTWFFCMKGYARLLAGMFNRYRCDTVRTN